MKSFALFGLVLFLGVNATGSFVKDTEFKDSIIIGFNGNILYVGGSGPGNYTKIQDAINNSSNGDTVFVYDESSPYYENIVINKSMKLEGENKETTVIDGKYIDNVIRITRNNTSFIAKICCY